VCFFLLDGNCNGYQGNGYQSNGYQSNNYQSNNYQSNNYQSNNGYQSNGYQSNNGYFGNKTDFQPIRSASPSETSNSSSPLPMDFNSEEFPGAVDLFISNLDYNISPREWKHILMTNFNPHVKVSNTIFTNINPHVKVSNTI